MKKKSFLIFLLLGFVAGLPFAQTEFSSMPKNTITVDIGPTIIGGAIASLGDLIGEKSVSTSGFGIGLQYERQILEQLSVAGRFAYLGGGIGTTARAGGENLSNESMISSFSLEGHVRYYPFGGTFFLDGMLGYGNLALIFSGKVSVTRNGINETIASTSINIPRDYLKYGGKLGWRIDVGNRGGFVFEPSFGYYGAVGFGDTLVKKLSKALGAEVNDSGMESMYGILENFIFIGGPRLSLAFGWTF